MDFFIRSYDQKRVDAQMGVDAPRASLKFMACPIKYYKSLDVSMDWFAATKDAVMPDVKEDFVDQYLQFGAINKLSHFDVAMVNFTALKHDEDMMASFELVADLIKDYYELTGTLCASANHKAEYNHAPSQILLVCNSVQHSKEHKPFRSTPELFLAFMMNKGLLTEKDLRMCNFDLGLGKPLQAVLEAKTALTNYQFFQRPTQIIPLGLGTKTA